MAREPKARPARKPVAEKPQRERFMETARELGVDESGEELMRVLKRLLPEKRPKR